MGNSWITTSSTHVEAMVNSLNAACDRGFVPNHLYVIENPTVTEQVDSAIDHAATIIRAYDGGDPEFHLTTIDAEVAFDSIRSHVQDAIEEAKGRGDEVAVDITPGRKFMSAIAFAAGMRYEADHVFYFYLAGDGHFGQLYPEIPRTASRLYDFTEEP